MRWTAVGVSIRDRSLRPAVEKELQLLVDLGILIADEIRVIEDACEEAGSAGSALNCLLIFTEILCAKRGFSVLNESVLDDSAILILLIGETNENKPLGAAFLPISSIESWNETPDTVLTRQLFNLNKMRAAERKGVWICGTDSYFNINETPNLLNLSNERITVFSFLTDVSHHHGSYEILNNNRVSNIKYPSHLNGDAPIVLALIYMPSRPASIWLSLHSCPPISASTYIGQDSGSFKLKMSLFFDVIAASTMSEEKFVEDKQGETKIDRNEEQRKRARSVLWRKLHGISTDVVMLNADSFVFIGNEKADMLEPSNPSDIRSMWLPRLLNLMKTAVENHPIPVTQFRAILALDHNNEVLIQTLKVLEEVAIENEANTARSLSTASDLLYAASRGKAGLRSGPAANRCFAPAFRLLKKGHRIEGIKELYRELISSWLDEPERMIRGARHMEAAAHIVFGQNTLTMIPHNFDLPKTFPRKCLVKMAARCDIFGGWLDTPPITFMTVPSSVVNMAIEVDGQLPLSCSVEWTDFEGIIIESEKRILSFTMAAQVLSAHSNPQAEGALICACLVALKIVSEPMENLHCLKEFSGYAGLRIKCNSNLPHGSGLGTSSILGACILGALTAGKLKGKDLIHMVLYVEHLLTTGGGWQDQVGGIEPGIKSARMKKRGEDSWEVSVEPIPISKDFEDEINRRLVLIYTGQTRLAKNLLQDVVRNWFSGGNVVNWISQLQQNVDECCLQLKNSKFPSELTKLYYDVKKNLANGCEPSSVSKLISDLKRANLCESAWLAGAGGGGFLYVWLTSQSSIHHLRQFLDGHEVTVHSAKISYDNFVVEYD